MSSAPVLAAPPGEYCFKTVQHTSTPVGIWEHVGGMDTCIAYPPKMQERSHLQASGCRADFDTNAWIRPKRKCTYELLPQWIEAVKAKYGGQKTKYVAVGYSFGAPDVLDAAASDWLAAGAVAHPTFLTEDHFQHLKQPLFLSCAEIDHTFPLDSRRRAEDILIARGADYHFQVFGKVSHGFTVRGDPAVSEQRWAKEESARGVMTWLDRFCKA